MSTKIRVEFPEIVDIKITIDVGSKERTFEVGRKLQNHLEGLFNDERFKIREASFRPYIIRFGCPTTENVKALAETIERIVQGFLEGKREENGQD